MLLQIKSVLYAIRAIKIRAAAAFSASFSPPSSDPLFVIRRGKRTETAQKRMQGLRGTGIRGYSRPGVRVMCLGVRAPSKIRKNFSKMLLKMS